MLVWAPLMQDSSGEEPTQSIRIQGAIVKIIDSAKVPAELSGVLSELTFREGQQVQKGELLAKIKSNNLSLELKRAKAKHRIAATKAENQIDIQFAKKSAEVSLAKLSRSLSSNQRAPGVVSRGRIQELEMEAHRDKLRVERTIRGRDGESKHPLSDRRKCSAGRKEPGGMGGTGRNRLEGRSTRPAQTRRLCVCESGWKN